MENFKKNFISMLSFSIHEKVKKSLDDDSFDITKNNIVLLTSFGLVEGKLVLDEEDVNELNRNEQFIHSLSLSFKKSYYKDNYKDDENNKYFESLQLKDVSLYMGFDQKPLKLNYLVVFIEDIIGITIGNLNFQLS